MDVVEEGKITLDEPVARILETLIAMKNYPSLVLRITDQESDLEGRIAISQGIYILGGCINNTETVGYPAVRALLSVKKGTYAVLDPDKQPLADINQTLWILMNKIQALLPNLPDTPEDLFDLDMKQLSPGSEQLAGVAYENRGKAEKTKSKPLVTGTGSRVRDFNEKDWEMFFVMATIVFGIMAGLGAVVVFDSVWENWKATHQATPALESQGESGIEPKKPGAEQN